MACAQVTAIELTEALGEIGALEQANGWLARGDGIAVYEGHAFDRSDFGERRYVSFGSTAAQLEVEQPPQTLPDIGNQINWAFQLIGTYRGEPLAVTA